MSRRPGRWFTKELTHGRSARPERGAVTAELALGLPLLLGLTVGLVWLLAVGAAQIRVVDGARETARAAARGDAESVAVSRGVEVAGPGSRVSVVHDGSDVRVTVTRSFDGPGGLLAPLPGVELSAVAVAASEGPG